MDQITVNFGTGLSPIPSVYSSSLNECLWKTLWERRHHEKRRELQTLEEAGFVSWISFFWFCLPMFNVKVFSSHLVYLSLYLIHISCSMGCVLGWYQEQRSCWFHGFYQKLLCFLQLASHCSAELTNRLRVFFLQAWEI